MEIKTRHLLCSIIFITVPIVCEAFPALEQEFNLEAYQKDGDTHTLVLRIQPKVQNLRQARQEDEDDDDSTSPPVPATTPFIPAVIPALTQIFQGILTGNLNEIFHGSTAFAPQNVSYAIDSVYNQVVGIAPPVSTAKTTRRPPPSEQASPPEQPQSQPEVVKPTAAPPPPPPAPAIPSSASSVPSQGSSSATAASSPSVSAGQPLDQGFVVITTTVKASSNEDDEDEDSEGRFANFALRNGIRL